MGGEGEGRRRQHSTAVKGPLSPREGLNSRREVRCLCRLLSAGPCAAPPGVRGQRDGAGEGREGGGREDESNSRLTLSNLLSVSKMRSCHSKRQPAHGPFHLSLSAASLRH